MGHGMRRLRWTPTKISAREPNDRQIFEMDRTGAHGISDLDFVALSAVQVCYANMPRPQTAQTCGAHNFQARTIF